MSSIRAELRPRRRWGAYADLDNIKGDLILERNGLRDVLQLESLWGRPIESVMWYPKWRVGSPERAFPRAAADLVRSYGAIPHLVWEACLPHEEPTASSISLAAVARGEHDDFLRAFGAQAAEWGGVFFLRFFHEFNGGWYSWGAPRNGFDAALYIEAWIRVVSLLREAGAANAQIVWSPNVVNGLPESDGRNAIERYWPGENYVDWIGMDGYNFFPYFDGPQPLLSFEDIFRLTYERCVALSGRTRLMVAEFGCGEYDASGHRLPNKAAWIADMFETLERGYERIEWLFWFHVNKEREWRVDSSPAALAAFRRGLERRALSATP
ncbi:MAG: glycosyl hydrolase [Kiritimatiellae bacterium]|nr:glycosyl hydrolase [Kiritimatiellia bacterium]MDW8457720.1 glycosyl hydrolase [Verrucomicrobiota bacterium]